jgi:phosphoribosylanthranilate isomerase
VLQCWDPFPNDLRVDWLFDVSFGTGQRPTSWPVLPVDGAFCGYSGGIGPANVAEILATVAAPAGAQYWIDMESGVRTDGWFDLAKCEAVCRAVFG